MAPKPAVPGRKPPQQFVARVRAVTFKSDHRNTAGGKLLMGAVDNPTRFTNHNGRVSSFASKVSEQKAVQLLKPDWSLTVPRNDPISHTMGLTIRVDIEILFKKVPNGSATLQQVVGSPTGSVIALAFNLGSSVTVKDGDVVTLSDKTSNGALPSIVGIINESIRWTAVVDGRPPAPIGDSGPHKIFMTLGQPIGQSTLTTSGDFIETGPQQAITIPRMEFSVTGARGADTERRAADRMFEHLKRLGVGYVLGFRPVPPGDPDTTGINPPTSLEHYLWLCNSNKAEGECHVIAAGFRAALRMIGVAGPMDVGFMRPHPGRQESPPAFPRRLDILKGRLNVTAQRVGGFHMVFFDGNNDANNFEGVVKFGNALYAIGDAIFDRNTAPLNGLSADDLNSTDYFTDRPDTSPRSLPRDVTRGLFDLKYVKAGTVSSVQYPWSTVTGAPSRKLLPGTEKEPFRWED